MKVAVIAPSEIPARRANTMQVMKMTQAIAVLGHQVRLAVPAGKSPGKIEDLRWEDLARHYGLQNRFPVEGLSTHPWLRRYDYGCRSIIWARRWGADLLYTRLPQSAAIASLMRLPTVLEMHDLPQGSMGHLLFRLFLRGGGARRLVVITNSLLGDLASELGAPEKPPFTLVLPDGVDLSRYDQIPETGAARQLLCNRFGHCLASELFVAGYTGHLYQGRGVELMLEMAKRLPEMGFLLAGGEPDDVAKLEKMVQQRGLNNVTLAGFVHNAELPVYQAACDVLLMPYQRHVAASSGGDIARYLSPMKLFEYMACGRPILSSNLPVLREVLQPDFAMLLPPDDANEWVTAMRVLADNSQLRAELGQRARINASRFTWLGRAERVLAGIES